MIALHPRQTSSSRETGEFLFAISAGVVLISLRLRLKLSDIPRVRGVAARAGASRVPLGQVLSHHLGAAR